MPKSARRLIALITALGVFALDRWSKSLVETNLNGSDTIVVIPGLFDIIHSRNAGVAFGLFSQGLDQWRTIILIALSIMAVGLLAVLLWRIDRLDPKAGVALTLILGGALGNVYDRVTAGLVTDFLDFYYNGYHWYTFNLADVAISVGALLLVQGMLFPQRRQQEKPLT